MIEASSGQRVRSSSGASCADARFPPCRAAERRRTVLGAAESALSQHSLVVVLTGLEGASADAATLRTLAPIVREHTVLVASATDPGLAELRGRRSDSESAYVAAAAEQDLLEIEAARDRLRRAGAEVVEASPAGLAPALADSYLALKAAGRL